MNAVRSIDFPESPLRAIGLTKHYDRQPVLSGLSIAVPTGSVLGLIGRNGAGKSTLLRCLLGLTQATGGQAFVFGEPALAMSDATKARLAYVPQQPDAMGWLEVREMLAFVGRFYPNWDRAFVETMLDRWELPRKQQLAKLSPGERERVALIRALASRPDLLVLDEPVAALDPVARRELLREIVLRASEHGTTVVFSTHIVSDLERVASHVAFLHKGRMLVDAPLDDLKEGVLRVTVPPALAAALTGKFPGELARRPRSDGGLGLVLQRSPDEAGPDILRAPGVTSDALGLEDLFVEVVQ